MTLGLTACGDDPATDTDTTTTDTAVPTDTGSDVADTADTAEPDVTPEDTDTAPMCEHACANGFGQNDKSLCPVPQSEWNCVALCCVPVFKCQQDADCATKGFELEQCNDDRFGCHCQVATATCFTWYCGADSDCDSGQMCAGGRCMARPTSDGLSIRILDRASVLTPAATLSLHVEAYDPTNLDVVIAATPTWTSNNSDAVAVDASGQLTGGNTAGLATITATLGAKTDTLVIENVLPDPSDALTVIVRTELTMEPVTGSYAIGNPTDGYTLDELPLDGVIRIAGTAANYDVHVLADGNDWVSWMGAATGTTLYLPIPKASFGRVELKQDGSIDGDTSILDGVGIVKGVPEFVHYDNEGAIELVLTSTGLSSALFDFSISVLLGSDVKRYFDPNTQIPKVDTSEAVTLPGGIIFNFLNEPAIPSYVATLPKGHHQMWSIGGRLDINELAEYSGVIFDAIGGGALDFTQIVGAVFPLFRGFRSGYVADVTVDHVGLTTDVQDVSPKLATPMGVFSALDVPKLPRIGSLGYADGLFLIGGAQTADGFMIVLGLNGGADTSDKGGNPPDGFADGDEHTSVKDPFSLPFAPLHSGLQGPHTQYISAAIAASIPAGSDDHRPSAGSATLLRAAPGEKPPAAVTLPAFLDFPTVPASNAYDAENRTVDFQTVAGSDLQRILFKGKRGKHWTFYGVTAGTTLAVPTMAALGQDDADDRLNAEGLESVLINSIDFTTGVDLAKLGRPGGVALDLLLQVVERVSFVDIKHPLAEGAGDPQ